jgi:hypothetical protein
VSKLRDRKEIDGTLHENAKENHKRLLFIPTED